MFHIFFSSLAMSKDLSFFFVFFYFSSEINQNGTPAQTDELSLGSEWQQISSGLLDSSKNSGQFYKCCGFDSSPNL